MNEKSRTIPKRVRMIFSTMASPDRIGILRVLNTMGNLSYSDLKTHAGFNSKKDSGKFAYHLRKLLRYSLLSLNKAEKKYAITNLGKLVINLAKQVEERSVTESGKMYVKLSRGSAGEFSAYKITQSLVREAGLSLETALNITEEAEIRIFRYQASRLTGSLIRDVVNIVLLEHSYEEYRNRFARVGLSTYDIQESMDNVAHNDDSVPEDLLLKAGRAAYNEFFLSNNIFKDVADYYCTGDLHIANPGLWFLLPDVVFLDLDRLLENGVDTGYKLPYVSRMPAAQNLDELASLLSMYVSLSQREASQEVVMDGLVPLLARYTGRLSDMQERLALALAAASASRSGGEQAAVSFRIRMGESPEIIDVVLDAYKRYVEITEYPKINLVIDYSGAGIAGASSRLAEIIQSGGNVAFTGRPASYQGVVNAAVEADPPSMILSSVSVNLPRLALESNKDGRYFRANLAILMEPVLDSMIIRRRHILDLIRKGLCPILAKGTQHMQYGSMSMALNLVGLREANMAILGGADGGGGFGMLREVAGTTADVARKKGQKSDCDIRACMLESGGISRLSVLDTEKYGKNTLLGILPDGESYSEGVSIDASAAAGYSEELGAAAGALGGGLCTFLEFGGDSSLESIKDAVEAASRTLPFFRPRWGRTADG